MVNLESYERRISEIRRYARDNGISEKEVNVIFEDCLRRSEEKYERKSFDPGRILFAVSVVFSLTFFCAIGLYNHPPTLNLLLRNVQTFIYPGLKVFRKIAVPVTSRYPSLTEWYDEWCLLENPYFQVSDMACWPCSTVRSVPDLTGHNISSSFNVDIPYTRKETERICPLAAVVNIYQSNRATFDEDAPRISSNDPSYRTISDVMSHRLDLHPSQFQNTHVAWRISRMKPGRILRRLFPKPSGTPSWWGPSTEKFVFIDEPKSPAYTLPNSECSNVVLRCTSGERLVKLVPSPECQQKCRSSTILLSEQHTLWYNWWYWRPVSLPATNSTTVSVMYLTSFC